MSVSLLYSLFIRNTSFYLGKGIIGIRFVSLNLYYYAVLTLASTCCLI